MNNLHNTLQEKSFFALLTPYLAAAMLLLHLAAQPPVAQAATTSFGDVTIEYTPDSISSAGEHRVTVSVLNGAAPMRNLELNWRADVYDELDVKVQSERTVTNARGEASNTVTVAGTMGYASVRIDIPQMENSLYIPVSIDDYYYSSVATGQVVAGNRQSGIVGRRLAAPLLAEFELDGDPLVGADVNWDTGSGNLVEVQSVTDENGQVRASVVLSGGPGNFAVTATLPQYDTSVQFLLSAYEPEEQETSGDSGSPPSISDTDDNDSETRPTVQSEADDIAVDALTTIDALSENEKRLGNQLVLDCRALGENESRDSDEDNLFQHCLGIMRMAANGEAAETEAALSAIAPQMYFSMAETGVLASHSALAVLRGRLADVRGGQLAVEPIPELTFDIDGQSFSLQDVAMSLTEVGGVDYGGSRWGVFVGGGVQVVDRDETDNEAEYELSALELNVGVDYRLNSDTVVGGAFAMSAGETEFDTDGNTIDQRHFLLSGYLTSRLQTGWFIDAILSVGNSSNDIERSYVFEEEGVDVENMLEASTSGVLWNAAFAAGKDYQVAGWNLTPSIAFDVSQITIDEFEEDTLSGDDSLSLAVDSHHVRSARVSLNADVSYAVSLRSMVLLPQLKVGINTETVTGTSEIDMQFKHASGDAEFTLLSDDIDAVYANVLLGASLMFANGIAGYFSYDTRMAEDDVAVSKVAAGMRWEF